MKKYHTKPFTLIELLLVIALLVLLAGLLLPVVHEARQRTKVVRCVVELRSIMQGIDLYRGEHNEQPPLHLTDIFQHALVDPWGNPYVYNHFSTINKGKRRKDKNLVPINTAFDLYSTGRDGESVAPLTSKKSKDDVIVADDGEYIGLAENY